MGFIKHLLGIRGVGRVTTSFREDGNHRVTVERDSATSPSLDAAALAAILFLYYAAKALHAVGSGPDADELRQDIALCALALRAMNRSPLGLDLYLWLTYRTFNLTRPMRLTWTQLYRQFGVNPARATDQVTVDNFRRDCLRELKKIKHSWPDLHYRMVKGALLLSPSPPAIAPSKLRLVE